MSDPYQVLGVSPSATDDEIKAAYRSLAKKYHPDRNNGSAEAEQKMMQINDAYAQIVEMRKNGGAQSGYQYNYGYGGSGQAQQYAPEFNAVRQQLAFGNFQAAMQMLEQMNNILKNSTAGGSAPAEGTVTIQDGSGADITQPDSVFSFGT